MMQTGVSAHVNASPQPLRRLYEDVRNWGSLFPATIRSAKVVRRVGRRMIVEVAHNEGKVMNVLTFVSPVRIDLLEFKRRYAAHFINLFEPETGGARAIHSPRESG